MIRRIVLLAAVLLAFFAAPAFAQYVPGQPGFIIDPTEGYPGDSVNISGQGCPASSTAVITINGEIVGSLPVSPDDDGVFQGSIILPDLPAGTYTVIVECGAIVMSNSVTILERTSESLPITGSDSLALARWALLLVAGGGLVLIGVRGTRSSSRVARHS